MLGWDSGGAGLEANILPSLCLAPEETSLMEGMVETSCNTDPFIGYSLQQLQESRETALSQIVPGSRKAVLRLSDGREVTLEKETTCVLTEEDGTRISVGGQEHIVYQAVSQEQEKLAYNTITVPRGGEYSLVLSDGTRVWLNAETELTYPTVFGKGERKLMLKGEACFEVVTDTARPFIVESFYNRVEVLVRALMFLLIPVKVR